MGIQRISPEALAEAQKEEERRLGDRQTRVRHENARNAGELTEPLPLKVGGRFYRGQVSFADGAEVMALQEEMGAIEDEGEGAGKWRDYQEVAARMAEVGDRCLVPVAWTLRLLWRAGLHRPCRGLSEAELGRVMAFLSWCRTRQRVHVPSGNGQKRGSTSRTSSRSSSARSRPGRTSEATP